LNVVMGMGNGLMAAIGVFDGVHRGHRDMLRQLSVASSDRGMCSAVVTFLRHPLEVVRPEMAPPLLMPAQERIGELQKIEGISVIELDFTPELQRLTAREFMAFLRDNYGVRALFMGYNHRFGSDCLSDPAAYDANARSLGMEVVRGVELSTTDGSKISSSVIRKLLLAGDVRIAEDMLGRPYQLRGTVVDGKRLGRRLGFPTANVRPSEPRQLIPACGVYACRVITVDGVQRNAMVNIGVRPTVERNGCPTIEAHIFDFDGDLYGQPVALNLIARLRDERCFSTIDGLRMQLLKDAKDAKAILESAN